MLTLKEIVSLARRVRSEPELTPILHDALLERYPITYGDVIADCDQRVKYGFSREHHLVLLSPRWLVHFERRGWIGPDNDGIGAAECFRVTTSSAYRHRLAHRRWMDPGWNKSVETYRVARRRKLASGAYEVKRVASRLAPPRQTRNVGPEP